MVGARRPCVGPEPHRRVSIRRRGCTGVAVDDGLPSDFGFPILGDPIIPHRVFAVPEASDAERVFPHHPAAVWRTHDGGHHWPPLTPGDSRRRDTVSFCGAALPATAAQGSGLASSPPWRVGHAAPGDGDPWTVVAGALPRLLAVTAFPLVRAVHGPGDLARGFGVPLVLPVDARTAFGVVAQLDGHCIRMEDWLAEAAGPLHRRLAVLTAEAWLTGSEVPSEPFADGDNLRIMRAVSSG
jgi:hypothetical protein